MNFPPFLIIFRKINTFQNVISPKAIELLKKSFPHLLLPRRALHKLSIFYVTSWTLNFAVSHVTSFSHQNPLSRKPKTYDYLEYKVLPSCQVWTQTDKNCKSYSWNAVSGVKLTGREIFIVLTSFHVAHTKKKGFRSSEVWNVELLKSGVFGPAPKILAFLP